MVSVKTGGYTHPQANAATVWTVNHNLGRDVIVDVFVDFQGTRQKILPKHVSIVNPNTLRIEFSVAMTGSARVV